MKRSKPNNQTTEEDNNIDMICDIIIDSYISMSPEERKNWIKKSR